jgi:hypothetical protein
VGFEPGSSVSEADAMSTVQRRQGMAWYFSHTYPQAIMLNLGIFEI